MSNVQQLSRRIFSALSARSGNLSQHTYEVAHQNSVPENEKLAMQHFLIQKEINFLHEVHSQIETSLLSDFKLMTQVHEFIASACNRYAAQR